MAFQYEFFGPIGTSVFTLTVPLVVYLLAVASSQLGSLSLFPLQFPLLPRASDLFSWTAVAVVYGWFLFQLALHMLLPAQRKLGVVEPDGQRWTYRLNGATRALNIICNIECRLPLIYVAKGVIVLAGLQNFVITYATFGALAFGTNSFPLYWAADHFLELLTASLILSISLSITLFVASHRQGAILAASGTSGCAPYDFWMGRELNPRIFGVDLKEFCELTPGLIGWAVLNLAFAHQQFVDLGSVRVLCPFLIARPCCCPVWDAQRLAASSCTPFS